MLRADENRSIWEPLASWKEYGRLAIFLVYGYCGQAPVYQFTYISFFWLLVWVSG